MQPYQRILCAVDFSGISEAAAARAAVLAHQAGAQLIFLHVVEYFPEDRSNELIAPESTDPAKYRERQARDQMTELANRLGCKEAKQEVLFSKRSAWHEIVRFAGQVDADRSCWAATAGTASRRSWARAPTAWSTVRPAMFSRCARIPDPGAPLRTG